MKCRDLKRHWNQNPRRMIRAEPSVRSYELFLALPPKTRIRISLTLILGARSHNLLDREGRFTVSRNGGVGGPKPFGNLGLDRLPNSLIELAFSWTLFQECISSKRLYDIFTFISCRVKVLLFISHCSLWGFVILCSWCLLCNGFIFSRSNALITLSGDAPRFGYCVSGVVLFFYGVHANIKVCVCGRTFCFGLNPWASVVRSQFSKATTDFDCVWLCFLFRLLCPLKDGLWRLGTRFLIVHILWDVIPRWNE